METLAPRVSVVIPVYNGINCLNRAIDSVLRQTYSDFEIVLVDDGSTDETAVLISRYLDGYPNKIKYFYKNNQGPGKAIEYGVARSSGEFIAFLDQDDCWFENKLELQIKELDADTDLAMVSTDYCRGEKLSEQRESVLQLSKYPDKKQFERLLLENPICAPSVVIRKNILLDIGFADIDVSYGPWDRPIWVKVAYKYKIKIMHDILMWKYFHESTLSLKKNYSEMQFLYWEHLLSYFPKISDYHKSIIKHNCADTLYKTAMYYFWSNDLDQFKSNILKAVKYDAPYIIRKVHFIFIFFPNIMLLFFKKVKKAMVSP